MPTTADSGYVFAWNNEEFILKGGVTMKSLVVFLSSCVLFSTNFSFGASDLNNVAMRRAIRGDNVDGVQKLLAKGFPINFRNKNGVTPLHIAVCFNAKKVVHFLLENGASPNISAGERYKYMTPFTLAFFSKQAISLIDLFFEKSVKIKPQEHILTKVYNRICVSRKNLVTCYLQSKTPEYGCLLGFALKDIDRVKFLLEKGFSLDVTVHSPGGVDYEPLEYVFKEGIRDVVEYLVPIYEEKIKQKKVKSKQRASKVNLKNISLKNLNRMYCKYRLFSKNDKKFKTDIRIRFNQPAPIRQKKGEPRIFVQKLIALRLGFLDFFDRCDKCHIL